MKEYEEMEIQLYSFITTALDGGEWSALCPGHFSPQTKTLLPTEEGPNKPQRRYAHFGEEIFCPSWESNTILGHPIHQLVTVQTML